MAAAVASSTEYLQSLEVQVREAGKVANVNYNMSEWDYKLKAKEDLLQRVQNLTGMTDEQQKLSKPIMNEVHDYDFNYLKEMVDKVGVKISELKKKQVRDVDEVVNVNYSSAEVDYKLVQVQVHDAGDVANVNYNMTEWDYKLKAKEDLLQRVQNLTGMTDDQQKLSKPIMNEVHDYDFNYLKEMVDKVGVKISELMKKQEYIFAGKSHSHSIADQ